MTDILTHLRNASRACTETYECALSINEVRQIVKLVDGAWQPIETVPKDGNPVMLHHRLWGPMSCQWRPDAFEGISDKCPWLMTRKVTTWPEEAFTHWMSVMPPPLPLSTPAEVDRFTQAMSEAPRQIGDGT